MASHNAQVFRDNMLEALSDYVKYRAEAKQIKAAVEQEVRVARESRPRVGGQQNPLSYDVDAALSKHHFFRHASSDRDASRMNAIMWGVAAIVESQES
jgi:hypothetical protein